MTTLKSRKAKPGWREKVRALPFFNFKGIKERLEEITWLMLPFIVAGFSVVSWGMGYDMGEAAGVEAVESDAYHAGLREGVYFLMNFKAIPNNQQQWDMYQTYLHRKRYPEFYNKGEKQ